LFIIGLLLRRALEQKSGRNLHESETRFRLIAETIPALVVEDGHGLLKAVGEVKPALVLLDIGMPLLNGLDAA
jgi:CheY-like chemotaxis protein